MTQTFVFVPHTLQSGYPLTATYGEFLPEPLGRYRTVESYPLVVPFEATCYNPGCGFEHRICGFLNRPGAGHRVEGDLFELDAQQLAKLDIEECYDPDQSDEQQGSFRRSILVEPLSGGERVEAQTHFNENETNWYLELVEHEQAEMVSCYTLEMAELRPKQCCLDNPGHEGLHTVTGSDSAEEG